MNGMVLQSASESKDIKFIDKKGADTTSEESGELFEKIVASLVDSEEKSEGSNFLLGKLLNISSQLDQKGKKISEFSKDDILSELKVEIDTKSNKVDKADEDVKEDSEDILLEDLFKIALTLKNGDTPNTDDIQSKPLKAALKNSDVTKELKSAKNIKELLSIADKNGIKVKNFEFFKEEAALNLADKKLVQKVTSQDIFKMIEPKGKILKEHKTSNQNILTKLINKDKLTKNEDLKVQNNQQPLIQKTKLTSEKEVEVVKTLKQNKPIHTDKKVHTSKKTDSFLKADNTLKVDDNVDINNEDLKIKPNRVDSIKQTETNHETKQFKIHTKTSQNTLSDLLKNTNSSNELKKSEDTTIIKDIVDDIKEAPTEKSSNQTELKTESTIKTKEPQDVKKSLNTFATEFKEKVESYKAPLMKVKMQLSPQNLGDVDVTLVNRGSTLQVNITSNNNSMAIFMQNQAEFKNSLVNMGFSDLQMNFSDNQSSQNQHKKQKDDEQNSSSFENINNEEENDSIDIIIPNYV